MNNVITKEDSEVVKKLYKSWLENDDTEIEAEEMEGLRCFLRYCGINLKEVEVEHEK